MNNKYNKLTSYCSRVFTVSFELLCCCHDFHFDFKKLVTVGARNHVRINISWCSVCVCVCVCVRVCLYSFTVKASSVYNDVLEMLERYGSTILCCEYYTRSFCQVPSPPFLKMSYFTFKDEIPAADELERKRYDILPLRKMIYIDMG